CSTHRVPSWSNVAIRSSGGTNFGLPWVAVVCTNSTIAFLAASSFQEGSGSVWALAPTPAASSGTHSAKINGRPLIRNRPPPRPLRSMSDPPAVAAELPCATSLLDLHVHAVGAQGELQALRGRHELHPDAVLVLHRAHRPATSDRRAGGDAGVVAVEILDLV